MDSETLFDIFRILFLQNHHGVSHNLLINIFAGLATVIGIKYESPGNDKGKRALKVKSYVSDEYKDLVELAALH
jgi:hypothetical protein